MGNRRLCSLHGVGECLPVLAVSGFPDAVGHIANIDELVDLDFRALDLVFYFAGVESRDAEILRRRRELLDAAAGAMMIGLHQAVRRYESCRAPARQTNRG